MGSTGYTCIRRTFCSLNILIWLCGCGFLGAGLWLRLAYQGYASLLPEHSGLSSDTLFMGIGGLSFIVSFFGCCGSWFQSKCLLFVYFGLVILLFLSEFIVGALAFLFRGGIGRTLANELRYGIEKHYNASDRGGLVTPSVSAIWDKIQTELQCCGVNSYEDWFDIGSWPGKRWVPQSCCRPKYNLTTELIEGSGDDLLNVDCMKANDPSLWWDRGCSASFQMWFVQRLHVIGIVGLVIAFLQLFGLITSMLLFCTMKHKKSSSETYKSYSTTDSTLPRQNQRNSYLDE